jgi:predicted HTH transcriptional regulator
MFRREAFYYIAWVIQLTLLFDGDETRVVLAEALQAPPFLAEVSSFANAHGADLVYGIAEAGGVPQDVCGFESNGVNAEMNRLEEMMRGGIEPRIEGYGLQPVQLSVGRYALVLRVPRSPARPHVITFKDLWRFYSAARPASSR